MLKVGARHLYEKIVFVVGEPTYSGEEAIVNVSVSHSPFKRDAPIPFRLRNFGGVWTVAAIGENPLQVIGAKPTKADKEDQERELRQILQKLVTPKSA